MLQSFLFLFSNNAIIIRHFAYLNNALLLVNVSRSRVQAIKETLFLNDVTYEEIQEAGEELGEILGRMLEAKIEAQRIIYIFEEQ